MDIVRRKLMLVTIGNKRVGNFCLWNLESGKFDL